MFVRTVLGDIDAAELGICYAHEHIIIDPSFATQRFPDFQLDSVPKAIRELKVFHSAGGRAMVDTMPCDAGRNVLKLVEISRATQVHIICPTGIHLEKYYPDDHWSLSQDCETLAERFVAEIEVGIDEFDYNGPKINRTAHKAGVIKVAGGKDALSKQQKKVFKAAALAHNQTGCPIITHTEQGTAALEQANLLLETGVDATSIVLSHLDRKPDLAYHREVLNTGVGLVFESAFRWQQHERNHTLDLIEALCFDFPNQIMLGMDAARPTYWKSYGGTPGLDFLLREFLPTLEKKIRGLTEQILVKTPSRYFSFSSV